MRKRFEYQQVLVQSGRATFLNDSWLGPVAPGKTPNNDAEALASCPMPWEYLRDAGAEGWELVSGVAHNSGATNYYVLFLKREA